MMQIVVLFIILISLVTVSFKYFSLQGYLKNHLGIFQSKNKFNYIYFLLFSFIIPGCLSWLASANMEIDNEVINLIAVVLSILTTMLFTMLALLFDKGKEIANNGHNSKSRNLIIFNVVKETYYAIMYNIFVSCVLLILLFIFFSIKSKIYLIYLVFFLLFSFILNLILILSNIYKIFEEYFK